MKNWEQRPIEIRNLFNPAFCGLILHRAFAGYEEEDAEGMPFSLSLLVLPLCLHRDTRDVMASSSRSYLLKVVERNPQTLVGFAERASSMLPFSLEALGLLVQFDCVTVGDKGRLRTGGGRVRRAVSGTEETIACQRVARFVGREFARVSDRVTIFTTLGVRP